MCNYDLGCYCLYIHGEASARLAHEPSRLGATGLLYPTMLYILYSMWGKMSTFFGNKEAGGEFDCVGVAVLGVGCTGKFDCCFMMPDGEGEFLSDEIGIWGEDSGANNISGMVGIDF